MNTIRYFLLLLYFVISSCSSFASSKDSVFVKDAIVLECLGHGLSLFSLHHEHKLKTVNNVLRITLRYGFGYIPGHDEAGGNRINTVWNIPLVISSYLGKKHHFLVLGVGYTGSFGKKWIDTSKYITEEFKGFESSLIISPGYSWRFDGASLGLYPVLIMSNHPVRWSMGINVGIGLSRRNKKGK